MNGEDYIDRGLLLLLGWMIVAMPLGAVVGALLAGAGGAAVGLLLAVPVGVLGYKLYLDAYWRR